MAFITYLGLFEFKEMPFGLRNVGVTYSRLAQRLKDSIKNGEVEAYLDDVLCHFKDVPSHVRVLRLYVMNFKHITNMQLC